MAGRLAKKLRDRPRNKLLVCLVAIVVLAWIIWAAYEADGIGFSDKTLWDWMGLLVIPAVLGIAAWWFNKAERKADRDIAIERQRQTTFTTYFDRMADLLLNKNLRVSQEDSEVRKVARALTISAFRNLDGERQARVIRFLSDLDLCGRNLLIIDLPFADLKGAHLEKTDLGGAVLRRADLEEADLWGANLQGVDLSEANLQGANLSEADLQGANPRRPTCRGQTSGVPTCKR